MNLKHILILSLFITVNAFAQEGKIDTDMLNKMSKEYQTDKINKSLENAISNNSLKDLAYNFDNSINIDYYFSHKVKTKGITNQNKSGRCWLYTGLNVLRPMVIEKYKLNDFSFSHTYLFFYDQLEKSNLFLEGIIATKDKELTSREVEWYLKSPVGDGGQWTGVVDLIKKYGIVPSDISPDSYNAENTREMRSVLKRKLREYALKIRKMADDGKSVKEIRQAKEIMLSEIYKILALTLGEPVNEFEWRYKDAEGNISELKKYTPMSFFKEFVEINLDDYVMFMDDPRHDYNNIYEVKNDRHQFEGNNWKYINLPADKIKEFAIASIKDNQAMYMSCDVGKQLDMDKGILAMNNYNYEALFNMEFPMDRKDRINTFQSASTHGMTMMAVDLDENGNPKKWMVENSWGMKGFKGHLVLTDEWFDEYVFRMVIHKKYISEDVLKILEKDAKVLPQWDIMF